MLSIRPCHQRVDMDTYVRSTWTGSFFVLPIVFYTELFCINVYRKNDYKSFVASPSSAHHSLINHPTMPSEAQGIYSAYHPTDLSLLIDNPWTTLLGYFVNKSVIDW